MNKFVPRGLTLAIAVALVLALLVPLLGHTQTKAPSGSPADPELIKRGEYLAHAADCVACHTAPGGAAHAGGRGMGSPLGVIYSTNITPDADTGIGRYTLVDFDRAMRRGIARDGHHLYPSMPYPSYAKISDGDIAAIYVYFMHRVQAVHQANQVDPIPWYLNIRWAMPLWNLLFLKDGVYQMAADRDAQWNRGAYLVQGLGHCSACHTPRGLLMQEKALTQEKPIYLSGASLDNWSAPDLRGDNAYGLGRWSEAQLVEYLKTGHNAFGTAFGSMIDAINYSTQFLTDADNQAIAHYLKSLAPAFPHDSHDWHYDDAAVKTLNAMQYQALGAQNYVQYCAGCHQRDGSGAEPYMPALAGNPAVLDPDPVSLINIVLNGSAPLVISGTPDFYRMASFRGLLDDQQLADVVNFMRSAWGNHAAEVTAAQVQNLRRHTDPVQVEQLNLLRMR
jgi:mono/diheme cytochrome c family protein